MRRLFFPALPLIALVGVAGCIPQGAAPVQPQPATPQPVVRPVAVPSPVPTPTPAPMTGDWRDWPLTPGTWTYRQDKRGSIALFGVPGENALLTLRCDLGRRTIYLSRAGTAPSGTMATIRTTALTRTLRMAPTGGRPPYMAVAIQPEDRLLDDMGYSRGRFLVEIPGMPTLVVPAWAEVLRVTQDCR